MTDRTKTLAFIKTAFGLATGRIRDDFGEKTAAANGILAVEVGAELIAEGLLRKPAQDLSERSDFKSLIDFKFEDQEHLLKRLNHLPEDEVEKLAYCAESFFTELVKTDAIPMTDVEKRKLLKRMARKP